LIYNQMCEQNTKQIKTLKTLEFLRYKLGKKFLSVYAFLNLTE